MSARDNDAPALTLASGTAPPRRLLVLALRLGVLVAFVSVWQVLADTGAIDPFFFSRPSAIAAQIWRWLVSGYIWPHLLVTLVEALLAFVIGTVLGIAAGLAFARIELLAAVFDPYIRIFNALPRVILAPIFILWFGLGIASKVALGVTLVFFVVFFNTFQGIREVDPVVRDNARMLQAAAAAPCLPAVGDGVDLRQPPHQHRLRAGRRRGRRVYRRGARHRLCRGAGGGRVRHDRRLRRAHPHLGGGAVHRYGHQPPRALSAALAPGRLSAQPPR
jgi:hypothetical protein